MKISFCVFSYLVFGEWDYDWYNYGGRDVIYVLSLVIWIFIKFNIVFFVVMC